MEKEVIFHVGPPRTGSTFLQEKLFNPLEGVFSFTKPKISFEKEVTYLGDLFHYSPMVWRECESDWVNNFVNIDNSIIISEERMWGRMLSPKPWRPGMSCGYEPPERPYCGYGPYSTANHISQLSSIFKGLGFDNTKILFVVRRQDEKFASEYAKISDRVASASQDNFERWVRYCIKKSGGYYRGGGIKMDYNLFYEEMDSSENIDEVLVYQYEDLKSSPKKFSSKIAKDLNLEKSINEGVVESTDEEKLNGRKNGRKWEIRNGPKFDYINIPNTLSRKVMQVYKESNKKMDFKCRNIDLSGKEYY